jgi:hypothetical protein
MKWITIDLYEIIYIHTSHLCGGSDLEFPFPLAI